MTACYIQQRKKAHPPIYHHQQYNNDDDNANNLTPNRCASEAQVVVPPIITGSLSPSTKRNISDLNNTSNSTGLDLALTAASFNYEQEFQQSSKKPKMMVEIAPAAAVYETFVQSMEPISYSAADTSASSAEAAAASTNKDQSCNSTTTTIAPAASIEIFSSESNNISNVVIEKTIISITAHRQQEAEQEQQYHQKIMNNYDAIPCVISNNEKFNEQQEITASSSGAVWWTSTAPEPEPAVLAASPNSVPSSTTRPASCCAPTQMAAVPHPESDYHRTQHRQRANSLTLPDIVSHWTQDIENGFVKAFDDERRIYEMAQARRRMIQSNNNSLLKEVKDDVQPPSVMQQHGEGDNTNEIQTNNKLQQEFVDTMSISRRKKTRSNSLALSDIVSDWDQEGRAFIDPFQDESHIPIFVVR